MIAKNAQPPLAELPIEFGGSGRGKHTSHPAAHKGGKLGGEAASSRTAAQRSASAKKAAATRKRNAEHTKAS